MKKSNLSIDNQNALLILLGFIVVVIIIFFVVNSVKRDDGPRPSNNLSLIPSCSSGGCGRPAPEERDYGCGDNIPIVGVVGGYGKTYCVDLIADVMRTRYSIGKLNKNGITIDNKCENSQSMHLEKMLLDPSVDAAVLGLSCNGIARAGLGFNNCDVGVFLNNREPNGKMGYHNLLYRHICDNGCAIVNCDDQYLDYLTKMMPLMKCKIICFSANKKSLLLTTAVKKGKPVIYYDNGKIIYQEPNRILSFNVQNVNSRIEIEAIMAAIGVSIYLGFSETDIKNNL